ncbi:MAG: HTH domain-containing protein, partial [Methanoregulaceae archaeon]
MKESAFRVLEILESEKGSVSGEEMSRRLGITRSMVWKHIRDLRCMGYDITSSQKEGYSLKAKSDRLLPYEVKKQLTTRFIGREMQYLENTPSTIWVGKQMFSEEGAEPPHGLVIIAEEQTGGVGRLGRAWVSPPGGIWISIIIKPKIPVDHIFM